MIDKISKGIARYIKEKAKEKSINKSTEPDLVNVPPKKEPSPPVKKKLAPSIQPLYRILIASSVNGPLELTMADLPQGIQLFKEYDNQLHSYFVGNYHSLVEAVEMQNQLRLNGFKGAYVVQSDSEIAQTILLAP